LVNGQHKMKPHASENIHFTLNEVPGYILML